MMNKIFLDNYYRALTGFWIILYLLLAFTMHQQASLLQAVLEMLALFIVIFFISCYLGNKVLPKAIKEKKIKRFVVYFLLATVIQSIMGAFIFHFFYELEIAGVFPRSTILYDKYSFMTEIISFLPTAMLSNVAFCGFRFYYEHTKLEKTHIETQLQLLKGQLTPHFMFNVLNHVYILMQEDVEKASTLLLKYSDILRYQLYKGEEPYIAIEQDVQFLKDFIDIETTRWIGKLDVKCNWVIENGEKRIPPLLFITLVENAFKHVSRTNIERGYVDIDFSQQDNLVSMKIENSKSKFSKQNKLASGLGLNNLKKRLDILYGNNYKMEIQETNDKYVTRLTIEETQV